MCNKHPVRFSLRTSYVCRLSLHLHVKLLQKKKLGLCCQLLQCLNSDMCYLFQSLLLTFTVTWGNSAFLLVLTLTCIGHTGLQTFVHFLTSHRSFCAGIFFVCMTRSRVLVWQASGRLVRTQQSYTLSHQTYFAEELTHKTWLILCDPRTELAPQTPLGFSNKNLCSWDKNKEKWNIIWLQSS